MTGLLQLLAERALALGIAVTVVLGCAVLAVTVSGNPLFRQRAAELGIIGATLAFVLLLLPLPGPVGQLSKSLGQEAESVVFREQPSPSNDAPLLYPSNLRFEPVAATELPSSLVSAKVTQVSSVIEEPHKTVPLRDAVAIVFAWGSLAMVSYLAFCAILLGYVARRASSLPAWLAEVLPKNNDVQIKLCKRSPRPFCFGLRKSHIVLPAHLAKRKNASLLRCVVQHELAHVQLGHLRLRQLIAACSVVLFAHPLYWWLARQQREAAELLADDYAAVDVGKPRYVEQLISLVEQLRSPRAQSSLSAHLQLSVLGAPQNADGPFYLRMKTLLMRSTSLPTRLTRLQIFTRGLTSAVLMVGVVFAFGRPASAQDAAVSELPPRVLSMTVDTSSEGVGQLLCRLSDNGVQISDLHISQLNEEGKRHVTFNIVDEESSVCSNARDLFDFQPVEPGEYSFLKVDGTTSSAKSTNTHIVQAGDTLANISRKYFGSANKAAYIAKLNGIAEQQSLHVGQSITIVAPQTTLGQDLTSKLSFVEAIDLPGQVISGSIVTNDGEHISYGSIRPLPNPFNPTVNGLPLDLEADTNSTLNALLIQLQESNAELRTMVVELQQEVSSLNNLVQGGL